MRQLRITNSVTDRTHIIDTYFNDVNKFTLLTQEEETELAFRIQKNPNDREAIDRLIHSNLRFVISVAKQYHKGEIPLADLINEGNLGLIKAATRFDPSRGFKFISFAVWWIRQSIMSFISETNRVVRLPLNKIGMLNEIRQVVSSFEQKHERTPTIDELSTLIDEPYNLVEQILPFLNHASSLDAPLTDDGESTTLLDNIPSDELNFSDFEAKDTRDGILAVFKHSLNLRERTILIKYFGLDDSTYNTLETISADLGLTRERVRQIKEKAIKKLKNKNISNHLKNII